MFRVLYFKCFDENRTHLHILATKSMLGHVVGVTPSTHNSSIQIRLKLDTVKRVQIITPSVINQTAG